MNKLSSVALAASLTVCLTQAADWPGVGGNPQREGWAKNEIAFTKENAAKLELLYKYKADNVARSVNSLTSPVINGFMITHLGFKEMLAFAGSSDNVFSIDADLNRLSWKVHFDYKAAKPQITASTPLCPGGLTTSLAMAGSSTAATARGGGGMRGAVPQLLSLGNFGRAANFSVVSGDGNLHVLNSSTGSERTTAPIPFVPPNAKLSALNILNNFIYVATQDGCGSNPNAIHGLDLTTETPKSFTFLTNGASAAGVGGTAISSDGTVFAQIPDGKGEVAGTYQDTVLALSPDLTVKEFFTPATPVAGDAPAVTPLVFSWKGRDFVLAGGRDGRLFLLDAKTPGGTDHHTPLFTTAPISGTKWQGTFTSWEPEKTDTRWIYAPSAGNLTAFLLEEQDGKPVLTEKWKSKDMHSLAPVVTANGLVFALATGQPGPQKAGTRATLYVLEGDTGKELYSSGNAVSTWSSAGLAVANRRIYFTTHDNLVYSFGFLAEQPQLTGK
ncbi:MAG: hypothetical protein JWN34_3647 [Bryobacterales bacterium]|nr:hypothetical protein [Bryobacterales bacterium]